MDLSWTAIPFPFLLVDSQHRLVAINPAAERETGVSPDSLGAPLHRVLGQAELPEHLDGLEVRLPGGLRVRMAERPWENEGTAYRLVTWLPAPPPDGSSVPGKAVLAHGPRARILVAEDEESIRDICDRALTQAGYDVTVVADGQAAIDLLAERGESFDLVLVDMIMPVAGGQAVYDYLRRAKLDARVIYATGYSALKAPTEDVVLLRKPYTLAQLLTTVRSALEHPNP